MNSVLKIHSILGNVTIVNPLRASRDGRLYKDVIPAPAYTEEVVKRDGNVGDTVNEMRKLISKCAWQTARLAPMLKGKDKYETCRNIWNFLYKHILYCEDTEGKEELRTPALSWAIRRTRGIDCDDFSIFCSTILKNLSIPHYLRIARYRDENGNPKDYFQHVYVVVPLSKYRYITIDAVLDHYDTEKQAVETKDFLVMSNPNLNGIDISVLGSISDDTASEIAGILTGADFHETSELEGLGRVASREAELRAIKNHLLRTRNLVRRHPALIREAEHPQSFLGKVDYALKYWDTDNREEALGILEAEEERQNELEGLAGAPEGHEDVDLFYGINGLGSYDVLGKAKHQKKFFAKVKAAVKKAGQGIKKIAKALVRFNPLTVTIRAAVLLALKVNLFKVASKLKWGYLTEEEAQRHGFDMEEWRKMKNRLTKAENLFVKTLQGKAENFKRAILHGRAGGLSGPDLGLGFVVAATTAASTTAAVPFITKIINLLKDVDFKKLIAKVDIASLVKGRKKAEEPSEPTEDGGSAIPDNADNAPDAGSEAPQDSPQEPEQDPVQEAIPNTPEPAPQEEDPAPADSSDNSDADGADGSSDDTPAEDDSEGVNGAPSTPKKKGVIKSAIKKAIQTYTAVPVKPANGNTNTNNNPNNLPAVMDKNLMDLMQTVQPKQNAFNKALDWVKKNPLTTALIGVGAVAVIYGIVQTAKPRKPRQSQTVAGIKAAGKQKAGKAKNNPPKAVSGAGKKGKPKKKGKGGRGKAIKL